MSQFPKVNAGSHGEKYLSRLPDKCPFCHKSVRPNQIAAHIHGAQLEVFFSCPNLDCLKTFIGYYSYESREQHQSYLGKTTQGILISRIFSQQIQETSSDFVTIYNQSFVAEQQNLTEICGVGYRKSLEFLIKDYTIKNYPTKKETIEKIQLSKVIHEFVSDANIKTVAKRAAWLGNDETHYIKKWEGKSLTDLKKLIDLTVHWIEMEILTASFEEEMPD